MERLQKVMAQAGLCSRRTAEKWILEGRVKINGEVCRTLGTKVSGNDRIDVDGKTIEKENFIRLSKNAGEIKFENGSKDSISTILMSIMQMWKQNIMYLNNEESRYLIELRDALLPDLMSGKLEI